MTFFTDKLKTLRKKNKLTQKELAEQIGIKQNSYSDWETGKNEPSLDNIIKLAKIFNITTDELLGQTKFALIDYMPLRDIKLSKIESFSPNELDIFKHSLWIQCIQDKKTLSELQTELIEQHNLNKNQEKILETIVDELLYYIHQK
ncbi:helix-turn-helix transcriptional regulator [Streptococcus pneumoniae]